MNDQICRLGEKLIGMPVFGIYRGDFSTGHVVDLDQEVDSCVIYWDEVRYEDPWKLKELKWDKSGKFLMVVDLQGYR